MSSEDLHSTASSAEAAKIANVCCSLHKFRETLCSGPATDFLGSFKSCLSSSDGLETLLVQASEARNKMISVLISGTQPEEKLSTIDEYLPHLIILVDSLHGKATVQTDKELVYDWQGPLTRELKFFRSRFISFEFLMVLQTKAIEHNHAAAYLLERDGLSAVSESGKHLVIAAGIMDYISSKLVAEGWYCRFNDRVPNPLEVEPQICSSLASLFAGSAQMLSIAKAVTLEKQPPALILSKLCVGVMNTFQNGIASLDSYDGVQGTANDKIFNHMVMMKQFFGGLAYRFAAQSHYEKSEVGIALGLCGAGKKKLVRSVSSPRQAWVTDGLPLLSEKYAAVNLAIDDITSSIDKIYHDADRDNRFIHFQSVPKPHRPPDLPVAASVMVPIPYREPERMRAPVKFVYVPPPSLFSMWYSRGAATTAANTDATNTESMNPPADQNLDAADQSAPSRGIDPSAPAYL